MRFLRRLPCGRLLPRLLGVGRTMSFAMAGIAMLGIAPLAAGEGNGAPPSDETSVSEHGPSRPPKDLWRHALLTGGYRPLRDREEQRRLTAWMASSYDRLLMRCRNADYTLTEFQMNISPDASTIEDFVRVTDIVATFNPSTHQATRYAIERRNVFSWRKPFPTASPRTLVVFSFHDGRRLLEGNIPTALARVDDVGGGRRAWRVMYGGLAYGSEESDDYALYHVPGPDDAFACEVLNDSATAGVMASFDLRRLHPLAPTVEGKGLANPFGLRFWAFPPERRDLLEWWESDDHFLITIHEHVDFGEGYEAFEAYQFRRSDGLPSGVFILSADDDAAAPSAWGSDFRLEYDDVQTAEGELLTLPVARTTSLALPRTVTEAIRRADPRRRVAEMMAETKVHLTFRRLNDAALDDPAAFDFHAVARSKGLRFAPILPLGEGGPGSEWGPRAVVTGVDRMAPTLIEDLDRANFEAMRRAGLPIDPVEIQTYASIFRDLHRPDPDLRSVVFEHIETPAAPSGAPAVP